MPKYTITEPNGKNETEEGMVIWKKTVRTKSVQANLIVS